MLNHAGAASRVTAASLSVMVVADSQLEADPLVGTTCSNSGSSDWRGQALVQLLLLRQGPTAGRATAPLMRAGCSQGCCSMDGGGLLI